MRVAPLGLTLVAACSEGAGPVAITFTTAAQSTEGCAPAPTRGLPAEVDRVIVQQRDVAGEWQTLTEIPREGGNGTLVERVPTGPADLRLVACEGPRGQYEARPAVEEVPDSRKRALVAHFRRSGALSCAGTGFGPAYDSFARLARPLAFAAAAPVPGLEQVVVVGGAGQVLDDRLQTRDDGQEWQLFDGREGLFWPGLERGVPITRRALDEGRAGLELVPWRVGPDVGLMLAGGAPSLVLVAPPAVGSYATGPVVPADGVVAEPALAFFNAVTGAVSPAVLSDGSTLVPRILAGIGQAADGRVLRAGGVEGGADGPRASAAAEVIAGTTVARHTLPAPLLGPTVTPLGADAFLVWGADVAACGAVPGYVVTLDPEFAATPLQFTGTTAPTCDGTCRTWQASAYHTATPLADGPEGQKRVLIAGGLVVRGADLVHNPDPGSDCPANVFVLSIDVAAVTASVDPVPVPPSAEAAVRRALHRAVTVGDRVLITGGWGSFGKPTSFVAGDDMLFYDDALPVGTLAPAASMARRRFAHVAVALPEGRVLLAGGLAPSQVVLDPVTGAASFVDTLVANDVAELYTPPLLEDPCPAAFAADDAGAPAEDAAP